VGPSLIHQSNQQALGSFGIVPVLDDFVENIAVLINGAPPPIVTTTSSRCHTSPSLGGGTNAIAMATPVLDDNFPLQRIENALDTLVIDPERNARPSGRRQMRQALTSVEHPANPALGHPPLALLIGKYP
jgi:hypothetical protein